MNDSLNLIDSYFNRLLPASERQAFEERCISDPLFAEEVAFYVSARDQLKQELHEKKKKAFREHDTGLSIMPPIRTMRSNVFRILAVAAMVLVVFLCWQLFIQQPSPEKIAGTYISNNLNELGKTMGGQPDSLQMGITSYNHKQYDEAEAIFGNLAVKSPSDPEYIKYLGIVYLAGGKYDKAIAEFEKLSGFTLFANPGPFYTALALMKRSAPGDHEKAKHLLESIVQQDLFGRKHAEEWIKKI
jgi:tetratricopeptide (TPR) repeat protein